MTIVELEFNYDNNLKVSAKYFHRIAEYCQQKQLNGYNSRIYCIVGETNLANELPEKE